MGLYDRPLVANYSGFYRMPLGNRRRFAEVVAAQLGSFGYMKPPESSTWPPLPAGRTQRFR